MNQRRAKPPSSEDDARLRELAERLLDHRLRLDPEDERPKLFVGRLPERLPVEVPIPEGFTIVGSVVRARTESGSPTAEVVLDTDMSPERASDAYKALMQSSGWYEPKRPRWRHGLTHAPPVVNAIFCRSRQGPALYVFAFANPRGRPGKRTEVRLRLETDSRLAPCTSRQFGLGSLKYGPGWVEPVLPTLRPPHGVRLLPYGTTAGSGPNHAYSSIILRTDMDPAALEAHYGAQFSKAGWDRSGGEASESQAWSAWSFTDKDGQPWIAALIAMCLPGTTSQHYFVQVKACISPDASKPSEGAARRPWWRRVFGG